MLLGAVGFAVARSGDGDDGDGDSGDAASGRVDPLDVLDDGQVELIRRAVPDPACGRDADGRPRPDDPALLPLDVLRLDGTCLVTTTELVAADEVDARRNVLERDPTVIAAAVVPPPSLDSAVAPTPVGSLDAVGSAGSVVAPAPAGSVGSLDSVGQGDDRRDDQWALDSLGVPEGSSEVPWPDGTGTVVAVIDTGIDAGHPDLAGAVVARRHFEGETELDSKGHGTHVAGIVAARSGNGGILGVAPAAQVLDVPIYLKGTDPKAPSWPVGLAWAVNNGADVVNMSFGKPIDDVEPDELELDAAVSLFARTNDVVQVGSAGNCGCDEQQIPSALADVVNVGAVQSDFDLGDYSSRVDVDLVAPGGGDLLNGVLSLSRGGGYEKISGTSQAAPHVAAAAAIARFVDPGATADEVASALLDTADLDRVSEGDRSGAGHGFLDIPGMVEAIRTGPSSGSGDDEGDEGAPAERTQVAFVRDGRLFAFDGTTAHPVRPVAPDTGDLTWVEWSADRTRLVGLDGTTLFSWAGPGTEPVETECVDCGTAVAYLEDLAVTDPGEGDRSGDRIVSLGVDGTLTEYEAASLQQLGSAPLTFPPEAVGSKTLHGDAAGGLVVHESGGAQASEMIWLVDPVTREAVASHPVAGQVQGPVAVSDGGDQVALVSGYVDCDVSNDVYVLGGDDLAEVAHPATPAGMVVDELFFNGDALFATMTGVGSDDLPCVPTGSTGLWRLDGDTWRSADDGAVAAARPLEGRTGGEPTGWLFVGEDGQGTLEPPADGDIAEGELGALGDRLWATPTRTEVDPTG